MAVNTRSFCSVKEGKALFSISDTALPHTSQQAFIPSEVEKKIQMEETVWHKLVVPKEMQLECQDSL